MEEKKKIKRDWLALTYIIPWAIGGTFTVPFLLIYFAKQITVLINLSYEWWLNIAVIFLLLKSPLIDKSWIDELKNRGFIK